MPIEFACEGCGKVLSVKDEYEGRRGQCTQCGAIVVAPEIGYEVAPEPTRTRPGASTIFPVGLGPVGSVDPTPLPGGPGRLDAIRSRIAAAALLCVLGAICYGMYVGAMVAVRSSRPRLEAAKGKAAPRPVVGLAKLPARQAQDAPKVVAIRPRFGVEQIVAQSEASVAIVRGPDSAGSGFLISPGLLATNAHVIRSTRPAEIQVLFPSAPQGRRGPHGASVVYFEDGRDLAILAVDSQLPPLEVDDAHVFRGGQEVVFIGNPVIGGSKILENAVGRGIIGSRLNLDGLDFYQLSGSVNGGNSGGPVIDMEGRVVAVVTARASKEEGIGICIPAADLSIAMKAASAREASTLVDAAARHADAVRSSSSRVALAVANDPRVRFVAPDPPVLAPDVSYRARVGDMVAVLRDETPASSSWAAMDEFARKELAGDSAGIASDLRSGVVVILSRRTDLDVVAMHEPVAVRPRNGPKDFATNVNAAAEFNEKHPAGSVAEGRLLYGPHEGKVLFIARVDVGRFTEVSRTSAFGRKAMQTAVRTPRPRRPLPDLATKAASALVLAEAIEKAGRVEEAERAYREIIRAYPATPSAERARSYVKVLLGR